MRFYIVSIFPESFEAYINSSIIGRAIKKKHISVRFYNPRDFTNNKHKKVDERPFGGGPGMVMTPEPILLAVKKAKRDINRKKEAGNTKIIIFSARGNKFTGLQAKTISRKYQNVILIAGRYEGIDIRVKKILKAEEISIGDYFLTGGELPAMVFLDAVSRQIDKVLGNLDSIEESRDAGSIVYTRPRVLKYEEKTYKVPKVLFSGDHTKIKEWRKKQNKKTK